MSAAPASVGTVDIAALKRRHPLGDVVEAAGVELRGRGRVRQGLCPFHEETEGSFTVYADTQKFYCFGCGLGGDVLDFVQHTEGVDLPEAIRRLDASPASAAARVTPAQSPSGPPPAPTVRDPALLSAAMRCYQRQLRLSEDAQAYLASRGINAEAVRRLGLGYASGRGLREWLVQAGFDDRRILSGGLTSEGLERFRGMIVVPDLLDGCVHWLAGRAVWPVVQPRFQALPGPKPVLGLSRLPAPASWIVVAEGLFDWLLLSAWDLPAACALGTQGMDRLASALQGQPRVFLAFDADEAGSEAAHQLGGLLGPHCARVVTLPDDIGDVAELGPRPDGRVQFLNALQRAAQAGRP
ncbi:MAG: CHC2 zinc finger domain-containing protein [Chloroflexi bacterium]|nr:CHC2 zinc finger domain-containing protein [Chloroflexota bacterium]MCY3588618.1 CHC2 zinc finger domain-containing protein [Chloroflexota bacterium]MCY3684570.1 CHC2 zinc finger domain-containing protein [Chloroflexota bacterium]MDE2710108.1 CHC2 zinc finger domain-containing protein [Chloroflexota bacterium]